MISVPFVDLAARHASASEAIESRVLRVLRSGRYVAGPEVETAERWAASLAGRRSAVGLASGTDALSLALSAVGVRAGDEVMVPAVTFFATAGAVCMLGATPVCVEVDERGLLDPEFAAQAVSSQTRAVVPVHLFGNAAPLPDLGVPVVDDAAQSIGGAPLPGGLLTATSCYPTKVWGTAAQGGFVLGDSEEHVQRVRTLANHGTTAPHTHASVEGVVGRNARMAELSAAVLNATAELVPGWVAKRRSIAATYDAELPAAFRPIRRDESSVVSQYVVRVANRAAVAAKLAEQGISTGVYYPHPLTTQPALSHLSHAPCPQAQRFCDEVLALPCSSTLTEAQLHAVIDAAKATA